MIWLDFETRSYCDLPRHGAYAYAQHPSTQVLCMAWALDDGEVELWTFGEPFPQKVSDAILSGDTIRAHNAAFERLIFWYVLCPDEFDVPEPKLEQFYCTAAQARSNCMPGSLEDAGRFAGAGMRKDHRGAQLVRKCCIPPFKHTEQDMDELFEYCKQDVRAMRAVSKSIRQLSDSELADYHVNERINDRGVRVDVPLAHAAMAYAAQELRELTDSVRELTEGAVTTIRSPALRAWVLARLGPEARKLAVRHKDGDAKDSLDKTVRANLLAFAEEAPDEIPPAVAEVIQATDDVWASSTAKYGKLAALADPEDARVRGAFVFAGGAATGRASSYGAQVHNIPRKAAKHPLTVRDAMMRREALVPTHGKRVTDVLKLMLRPTLIPADGHVFVVADWSAIEGRVNPWLADSPKGNEKLDVYRNKLDVYIVNASKAYGIPYNTILSGHEAGDSTMSDYRQRGKVTELSLAFGGGVGALNSMGRNFGLMLPDHEARRMVQAWRAANQWAPMFWSDLERAYVSAMLHPGAEYVAGRVTYLFDGQHLWYALPSGRVLCYPFARRERDGSVSYAKASWKPAADAKEWPRGKLWPGLACIAKGTPVLTERGWVPIERVRSSDRVWDGLEWVTHDGVAHQGIGRVDYVFGVAMTADHLVLTREGWKRADQTKGCDRASCRLPDGYETDRLRRQTIRLADLVRLRSDACHETSELSETGARRAPSVVRLSQEGIASCSQHDTRHGAPSSVRGLAVYAGALSSTIALCVEKLWRARDLGVRSLARIVRKFLGRHGADLSVGAVAGSYRQQRFVLTTELSMGDSARTGTQYSQFTNSRQSAGSDVGMRTVGTYGDRPDNASVSDIARRDGCRSHLSTERISEVFDLINCGPRRRFVVQGIDGEPLIVHNCENVTQASAHDVLREALRRLEGVVLHVHDEIVLEVPEGDADAAAARLVEVMRTPPAWAGGLPLDCEVKIMGRYGK